MIIVEVKGLIVIFFFFLFHSFILFLFSLFKQLQQM